jgi:hypothetical protein
MSKKNYASHDWAGNPSEDTTNGHISCHEVPSLRVMRGHAETSRVRKTREKTRANQTTRLNGALWRIAGVLPGEKI